MTDPQWRAVSGVLMTSEPIGAYGGLAIPAATLRSFADNMSADDMPFHVDHDLTRPVRVRGFNVFVEDRSDGITELRFRAEMHPDDVHLLDSRSGMSATVVSPIERDIAKPRPPHSQIQVSADHAWFEDAALIAAEARLLDAGLLADSVSVERAYQFAAVPDPQIFVTVVYPVLLSIGASAIWDAIKLIFARRRTPPGGDVDAQTTVNLEVIEGDRSLRAVITTDDIDVAKLAVGSIRDVAADFYSPQLAESDGTEGRKRIVVWDSKKRQWS